MKDINYSISISYVSTSTTDNVNYRNVQLNSRTTNSVNNISSSPAKIIIIEGFGDSDVVKSYGANPLIKI